MVNVAVLGQWLNSMILEGFSKLNNSLMTLAWQEAEPLTAKAGPSLRLEEIGCG